VGLAYIGNAIQLDPGDPRWKDALDSAKAEPIRRRNYRMLTKLWNTTGADATNQR
jgi:hypothetical protein